ncbi:carbohydrate ABC transporter permease [Microbacterium sp. A196]|uniref:carbohydrate ABC transporter permease n=1 Tax=Microbacterium sp. A196 TaxID=3457320 RepID=UPI003FD27C29
MHTRRFPAASTALLPALAIYAVFILLPLVQGLYLSFTDSNGGPRANFVGLDNYAYALAHPDAGRAIWNTLIYTVFVVVVQNGLGLVLARALSTRSPRVRTALSLALLCPTLISPVMAAFIWSYLYRPDGAINSFLGSIGLDALQQVWLGDPATALIAVGVVNVWMFTGYSTAIFLAGFLGMPKDILEAASIDGATGFQRFFRIEWPLLAPALTVNITLSLIGCLRVFEFPLVMTNGGPAGSTQTLTLLIYRNVFGDGDFAYGITLAVVLLVLIIVVAGGVNAMLRRREQNI